MRPPPANETMPTRYHHADLIDFSTAVLTAAGMEREKPQAVAAIRVEGDLMGHTTRGLALLAGYLTELESGAMLGQGGPEVLADYPAAVTWDERRRPGPCLALQAIDLAMARAAVQGTCTVVIEACRASRPTNPERPVRRPREKGMALAAGQTTAGVELCPAIMPSLAAWAVKLGVPEPQPIAGDTRVRLTTAKERMPGAEKAAVTHGAPVGMGGQFMQSDCFVK